MFHDLFALHHQPVDGSNTMTRHDNPVGPADRVWGGAVACSYGRIGNRGGEMSELFPTERRP